MKALGIDLGTTKVAAVIYDQTDQVLAAAGMAHHAAVPTGDANAFEQDVESIMQCVDRVVTQLPLELRQEVSAVGITGQMHSLLLKNRTQVSHLVTWQDHRCGADLIADFNRIADLKLREGFGGTTLARLARSGELQQWDQCATISDFLAAELCGNTCITTDPTHAASWGLYDLDCSCWNLEAVQKLNIAPAILPEIRPCGKIIGHLSKKYADLWRLPENIAVANAIGDNQASILGTGSDFDGEIYLTLGTGAQLSLVSENFSGRLPENIEIRPFPGNKQLLVAAPLCGGAAFAFLADTVNSFRTALGEAPLDRSVLLDKLDALGLEYMQKNPVPDITIAPHFLGERHAPELRGSISNLTLNNATPGALAAALAYGIVRNLKNGFPAGVLQNRRCVIGSGNAVRLVKSIQHAIKQEFALPLQLASGREEAASGAAKQALEQAAKTD